MKNANLYQGLAVHTVFDVSVNGGPRTYFPNIVPTEGRNAMLDIVFGSASKPSTLYLAPFAGNVTPQVGWTGNSFHANATEFDNYTEATRPVLTVSAASSAAMNNHATRSEITVAGATGPYDQLFRGIAVLTTATKKATSGTTLLSVARLPADRTGLVEGDVITLGFSISLSNPS